MYQKKYWNSTKIDFAYSYVGQSQDSLLQNLRPDKHIFWLAGAIRPGCDWAQILFSINTKVFKLSGVAKNEWTVNSRFYIGKNSLKAFVESQYNKKIIIDNKIPSYEKSLFLNLGFEALVYDGVWIHLGTGVQNYLDSRKKNDLLGNLNVYFTLPEKFNFF